MRVCSCSLKYKGGMQTSRSNLCNAQKLTDDVGAEVADEELW